MVSKDIFIVGSGHTKFGRLSETFEDIIVAAAHEAITDAQIDPADIDAIFLGHFNSALVPDGFPSSLVLQVDPALRFTPATRCENACASGAAAIFAGMDAIRAGRARNVLIVGAEKMTHRDTKQVTQALAGAGYQTDPAEAAMSFPQIFAQAAQLYAARYGDPLDSMARIAEKNHANAMRNPLAQMHKEMPYAFCREVSDMNPLIAPPLRLTDCSLVTDGAAAVVMSSEQGIADSAPKRVRIAAAQQVSDFLPLARRDFIAFEGPERAIHAAYREAGMGVFDLDFAEVHDCFTSAELLIYEAMGLTAKGEGARALEDGVVYADGKLPVNLSGGLKAKGHPVGATGVSMHALAYRQLTSQAGEMQHDGAELGLVFNMGGSAVANFATILHADRA